MAEILNLLLAATTDLDRVGRSHCGILLGDIGDGSEVCELSADDVPGDPHPAI